MKKVVRVNITIEASTREAALAELELVKNAIEEGYSHQWISRSGAESKLDVNNTATPLTIPEWSALFAQDTL